MSQFDTVAVIDWSGGNDTGPRPRKDAIWMGVTREGVDEAPVYIRNRMEAERLVAGLIEQELAAGRRLFVGFDFPFGYPKGFAEGLTGRANPFAVWDWLEERIEDGPRANNRFDLAAEINARFPGTGPFWFNGLKRDIPGLPRRDSREGHGLPERREAEQGTPGAFTCWQLGGAGAVGHNAVQLAKSGGATVIATCSTGGADRVKAAGADHVLDYADPELAAKITELTGGKGIDRAVEVEFGVNAALLAEVMKPLGTIAAYGSVKNMTPELPFGPYLFKGLKLDITLIYILPDAPRAEAIERLHAALADGALKPDVEHVLPLEKAAEAQDIVLEPGRAGAVLLELG